MYCGCKIELKDEEGEETGDEAAALERGTEEWNCILWKPGGIRQPVVRLEATFFVEVSCSVFGLGLGNEVVGGAGETVVVVVALAPKRYAARWARGRGELEEKGFVAAAAMEETERASLEHEAAIEGGREGGDSIRAWDFSSSSPSAAAVNVIFIFISCRLRNKKSICFYFLEDAGWRGALQTCTLFSPGATAPGQPASAISLHHQ
ncbi:hypothetical protein ACLOJK_028264 [Asimina triloba]